MTEQTAESYAATFETNVLGTLLSMKHELRAMQAQGSGSIVNISSTSATKALAAKRTGHATYCPYKGDASYFSIPSGGARSANAVWTYESPYAAVALIKDHLAFYLDRVDAIEERAGA